MARRTPILPHLARIAGGGRARILVCPSPSSQPRERLPEYRALFRRLGVAEVIEAGGGGRVVAGTSAGAAAMSSVMVIGGQEGGTVRREDVRPAPGLGFWRDTVVDAHFNQRGRVSRLMTILAHNPQVLGIGIDEGTAIDVTPGVRFTVLGSGAATVTTGPVTHTNAASSADDETLAITDAVLHVLPRRYGFDLQSLRPIFPGGETVAAPAAALVGNEA